MLKGSKTNNKLITLYFSRREQPPFTFIFFFSFVRESFLSISLSPFSFLNFVYLLFSRPAGFARLLTATVKTLE